MDWKVHVYALLRHETFTYITQCFVFCLFLCYHKTTIPLDFLHHIIWHYIHSLSCTQSLPAEKPTPHNDLNSNRTNVKSGVSALSSTSTAFGTAASNQRADQTGNGHIDESLRQLALAEEEAAMNQYKVNVTYLILLWIKLFFFDIQNTHLCTVLRQKYNHHHQAAQAQIRFWALLLTPINPSWICLAEQ